jgi:hypothetical protein
VPPTAKLESSRVTFAPPQRAQRTGLSRLETSTSKREPQLRHSYSNNGMSAIDGFGKES